jgi:hypothetical protein
MGLPIFREIRDVHAVDLIRWGIYYVCFMLFYLGDTNLIGIPVRNSRPFSAT